MIKIDLYNINYLIVNIIRIYKFMNNSKSTLIELRSLDGSQCSTYDYENVINLITNPIYFRVSYYDKNNNVFRWIRITKGEDDNETQLYNTNSKEFREAPDGTIFWINKPPSILCNMILDHINNNNYTSSSDYSIISNKFAQVCAIKSEILPHSDFCKLLRKIK